MTQRQIAPHPKSTATFTSCGHALRCLPPSAALIHHVMRVRPLITRKQMRGIAARAVIACVADVDAFETLNCDSSRECECHSMGVLHRAVSSADLDLGIALESDALQSRPAFVGLANLNARPEHLSSRPRPTRHSASLVHTDKVES